MGGDGTAGAQDNEVSLAVKLLEKRGTGDVARNLAVEVQIKRLSQSVLDLARARLAAGSGPADGQIASDGDLRQADGPYASETDVCAADGQTASDGEVCQADPSPEDQVCRAEDGVSPSGADARPDSDGSGVIDSYSGTSTTTPSLPQSRGTSASDSPAWQKGFDDAASGRPPSVVPLSRELAADYDDGYQAGTQWAKDHPDPKAPKSAVKMVEVPGSDPQEIPATYTNPLGLVGYKFQLPEGTASTEAEVDVGPAILKLELSLDGSITVLSESAVTVDKEGAFSAEAKRQIGEWQHSIALEDVTREGATLVDSFGSEFAKTSVGVTSSGALEIKGSVKVGHEIETPYGKANVEGELGYTLKIRVIPKRQDEDEGEESEDEETSVDEWWDEHGDEVRAAIRNSTIVVGAGLGIMMIVAMIVLAPVGA